MAIEVGNVTTAIGTGGYQPDDPVWEHTVTDGADRLLRVYMSAAGTGVRNLTDLLFNGISLTQVGEQATATFGLCAEIWEMPSPPSGAHTFQPTWEAPVLAIATSVDYSGVDLFNPSGAAVATSGRSATPTIVVPASAGDLVDAVLAVASSSGTRTPGPGQTDLANDQEGSNWNLPAQAVSTLPGAAPSVSPSWTLEEASAWGTGYFAIVASALHPASAGADPTTLGVPFLPPTGTDRSPGIDLGIAPELISLPFLGSAGVEFPPTIAATPVALLATFAAAEGADHLPSLAVAPAAHAIPFAASEGADHLPSIEQTPAALDVPFAAEAGSEFPPAIAVTPQAIGAPFAPQAGASWAPGITAGIPSVELELSFAAAAGQDFPPVLEHGIPAGVLAVPFAPELGEEHTPNVVPAAVLSVPFASSAGAEHRPAIEATVVAVELPLAASEGGDHAPAVAATPLVLLVPFSEATGAAFAPALVGVGETAPLQILELEARLARRMEAATTLARYLEATARI